MSRYAWWFIFPFSWWIVRIRWRTLPPSLFSPIIPWMVHDELVRLAHLPYSVHNTWAHRQPVVRPAVSSCYLAPKTLFVVAQSSSSAFPNSFSNMSRKFTRSAILLRSMITSGYIVLTNLKLDLTLAWMKWIRDKTTWIIYPRSIYYLCPHSRICMLAP